MWHDMKISAKTDYTFFDVIWQREKPMFLLTALDAPSKMGALLAIWNLSLCRQPTVIMTSLFNLPDLASSELVGKTVFQASPGTVSAPLCAGLQDTAACLRVGEILK